MDESFVFDSTLLTKRRLAFDLLPHDDLPELFQHLELPGGDPQGFEMEHMDSHARLRKAAPMMSYINGYSLLTAEIFNQAYLMPSAQSGEITQDQRDSFEHQNAAIIRSSCLAMVASFLDMGLLELGKGVVIG